MQIIPNITHFHLTLLSCIRNGKDCGEWFHMHRLCFVNYTPASVQCKIELYADNILLYSELSSINDCIRLQNNINYLFS